MSYSPKDSKYKPPEVKKRDAAEHGTPSSQFNEKGKITSNQGSDYHDYGRKDSGLYGNFAEKDASMEYLRGRNKDGQRIRSYHATEMNSELKIGGGATAFDSMPIPEVYHPATSQGSVPPNAIVYKQEMKDRNASLPKEQVTSPGDDHLTEDQTKHLKDK